MVNIQFPSLICLLGISDTAGRSNFLNKPSLARPTAFVVPTKVQYAISSPTSTHLKGIRGATVSKMSPMMSLDGFSDISSVLDSVLSNPDNAWINDIAQGLSDAAAVATEEAVKKGWFDQFVDLFAATIKAIHGGFEAIGIQNSYGLTIIIFTILVKTLVFPLTYKQLQSTTKMQAMQPKMKVIQAKYKNNPEMLQQQQMALYKEAEVNPLAGCLPAFAQIPIFIGLYRSLLQLAKENVLEEPFLWLPNLEGPTYGAAPQDGLAWLTKGWVDGNPPLGWYDTICFLSIPLILIISQSYSQKLVSPPQSQAPNDDGSDPAATTNAILKYLPIMVGWFSLSVPSGLSIYWIANNIVSTVSTVLVRQQLAASDPAIAAVLNAGKKQNADGSYGGGMFDMFSGGDDSAADSASSTTADKVVPNFSSSSSSSSSSGSSSANTGVVSIDDDEDDFLIDEDDDGGEYGEDEEEDPAVVRARTEENKKKRKAEREARKSAKQSGGKKKKKKGKK